jgi:hypothetical protein
MADVFISYSQKDKVLAEQLGGLLQEIGLTVWWDAELIPAEKFREEIRRQIELAIAVIVIWADHSSNSAFVIDEADLAREAGKLISTLAEGFAASRVPLGFRNAHMTALADGSALIRALTSRGVTASKPPSAFLLALFHDRMVAARGGRRWGWPVALAVFTTAVAAAIVLALTYSRQQPRSPAENMSAYYSFESTGTELRIKVGASVLRPLYIRKAQIYTLKSDLQIVKKEEETTIFYNTGSWSTSTALDKATRCAIAAKGYIATCIHFSPTADGPVSTIGIVRKFGKVTSMPTFGDGPENILYIELGAAEANAVAELTKQHDCNYRL